MFTRGSSRREVSVKIRDCVCYRCVFVHTNKSLSREGGHLDNTCVQQPLSKQTNSIKGSQIV